MSIIESKPVGMPHAVAIIRCALVLGAISALASCSDAVGIVPDDTYDVAFATQFNEVYIVPGGPCGPYCTEEHPDSTAFAGSLRIRGDSARLTLDGTDYNGVRSRVGDSVTVTIWTMKLGCGYVYIAGTTEANGFSGSWGELLDCHGLSRRGVFSATLSG